MQTTQDIGTDLSGEDIRNWFDNLISHVTVDKMMMETGTAPDNVKQLYTDVMMKDYHSMSKTMRADSTKFFISNLVKDYVSQLFAYRVEPQKLAFDFSDAKILVWAQIADDDEATEDALILSEAQANSKYADTGFYVSSTIVEESDNLSIPSHYHEVKVNGRLSGSH